MPEGQSSRLGSDQEGTGTVALDAAAFSTTSIPSPLDLMDEGDLDGDDPRLRDLPLPITRGLPGVLSPAQLKVRWQALVNRLRGYRADRLVLDGQPFWLSIFDLEVPPDGKATLRYSQENSRDKGAALKIVGTGFGTSQAITISKSIELPAERAGKSFQWKLLATVRRYVQEGEPPMVRLDVHSPSGGPEYRIVDLAPAQVRAGEILANSGEWRVVERLDLSSTCDVGHATWSHTLQRRATWNAGIGAPEVLGVGIQALKVESERSEQFEAAFELPYGGNYVFYCRSGDWPIAPGCVRV